MIDGPTSTSDVVRTNKRGQASEVEDEWVYDTKFRVTQLQYTRTGCRIME